MEKSMTNKHSDIRDFLSQNKFEQSENITNNKLKSNKVSNNLLSMNCAYFADDEISSSNETSSRSLAEQMPQISCIGVSMNQPKKNSPDRRVINVSVTWDNAENIQLSSNLAHYSRKRELKGTLADEQMKKWWGYDDALEFISNLEDPNEAFIGKLRNTGVYKAGTPVKLPIVPETACVHWVDNDGVHVMLWLGDSQYAVDLYSEHLSKKQKQFYVASGYYRPDYDIVCEKMF